MQAWFSSWQTCSVKAQTANVLGFVNHLISNNSAIIISSSSLNSDIVQQKQPYSIHRQMCFNKILFTKTGGESYLAYGP